MTATPLQVRRCGPGDAQVLTMLGSQVFLETYARGGISAATVREVEASFSVAALQGQLRSPDTPILAASEGERMVGFAQLTLRSPCPLDADAGIELQRLYVLQAWTGRGVGALLLREAEALARSHGALVLWLSAWVGNARALAFYARRSYEDIGRTDYRFEDQVFENRVFRKRLGASPAG